MAKRRLSLSAAALGAVFLLATGRTHAGPASEPAANREPRPAKTARLVLTPVENGLENASFFTCQDTVHGYITLPEKSSGTHVLEGIWRGPSGDVREHARIPLEFPPDGRQTAYMWLRFGGSPGLLEDVGSGVTPSRSASFNGDWRVQALWDGRPLVESKFKVRCP